ncbi:Gfo/Idh/MocA family oxidoreductase [Pedobacter sp. SD-b]|uniref:Gfo/Idh/MocA family oxidoreductase n=1 Tax=Pedobacter segetis TaxID=2793069 RepID=A0ABS1BKA2_9SPHI|nr:Gfo/Idh/MocA family oxidoreductase [Pedobacter segetis]MBK0382644.1 Gfo/Idh/MocA family oxidoreductase [Pedobacter segetis]
MENITWGILGCGDVTEVKSGPAFNKVANSKIEAVMRRNAEKAADYAKRHQIEKFYASADDLMNDDKINSIYIATPPSFHKEFAIQAMKAGKNVYIEKPVALNVAELNRMIEVEKQTGKKVTVAHYRRALPLFIKLKELIDHQIIGDVRLIDLKLLQKPNSEMIAKTDENWRLNPEISGGGLFYDLAPHQLDILVQIFGAPEKSFGFSVNQTRKTAADDVTIGQMLFKKDIVFNGIWNFNAHPDNEIEQCEIIGSQGKIIFSFFGNEMALVKNGQTEVFSFENPYHIQQNMIKKTVKHFLGKEENPCSLKDALLSLKIMESFTT